MTVHDNSYKNLFSHPQAVRDLLQGFVEEDWIKLLDFETLEKVSGSYVTDDLRDREDDIIWRVRLGDGEWLYVYLLLEFQSSNDPFMAVRILTYIGLLYQDLIKSGQLAQHQQQSSGSRKATRLPPVFPLVLYNGEKPWTAVREVSELIESGPSSLMAYQPQLRYFLLDEGRVPEQSLAQTNSVASLMRLERSASPQEISEVVGQLIQTLKSPQNRELRRAFTVWINRVVLRRFAAKDERIDTHDLSEVQQMISERVDSWTQQWLQQGLKQGLEQGLEKGLEQGLEQGFQQGQAQLLCNVLENRFGALSIDICTRIQSASPDQISAWVLRSVTATSLAMVFENH